MNINNDILRQVLLDLDDKYYKLGIKGISLKAKGIRREKIGQVDKRIVIPLIVKESETTISFLENIKSVFNKFKDDKEISLILENATDLDINNLKDEKKQLLYLYLIYVNDDKYDNLFELLSKYLENKKEEHIEEKKQDKKYYNENEFLELSKLLEEQKEISKNRKQKINELNIEINKEKDISSKRLEKINELEKKVEELKKWITELNIQLENNKRNYEIEKEENILLISNERIVIDKKNIKQIRAKKIFAEDISGYEKILVNKFGIGIYNLKKIKKCFSEFNVVFLETKQEVIDYIKEI